MKYHLATWFFLLRCLQTLGQDGLLDPTFDPGSGANITIYSTALRPDGKIVIGGNFTSYNGIGRSRVALVNPDGTLDNAFNPGTGADDGINHVTSQPDGKIIIGGDFSVFNGIGVSRIARLNADGSLDNGFNPGTGANASITSTALQPDGKIIIVGGFNTYNGSSRNHIARLNADGSLDAGFNPGTGANNWITSVTLQSDGKILIGGVFTAYDGTGRNSLARLNTDGSLDAGFNPGAGPNNVVLSISLQLDGKILIGGGFSSYNNVGRSCIARLDSNGTLDGGFDPGMGANTSIYSAYTQVDGKIIIAGQFISYDGVPRNRIARLNANGSLDIAFEPGTGANSIIHSAMVQPDGRIVIIGEFWTYNGTTRNCIARLMGGLQIGLTENMTEGHVIVSPALTSDNVTITAPCALVKHVLLFDAAARLIQTQPIANDASSFTLDLSAEENGLYFVLVEFADGRKVTARVVKE